MTNRPNPDALNEILLYNKKTGDISWRERKSSMFLDGFRSAKHNCKIWNAKFAGKKAGTPEQGYIRISIQGKGHLAHRIAWAMHFGEWPSNAQEIDHINGRRSDNRISNLRVVDDTSNARNQKIHRNNSSGVSGVSWLPRLNKWQVRIGINGREKYVGIFSDFDHAKTARLNAEKQFGYHINHGRVA